MPVPKRNEIKLHLLEFLQSQKQANVSQVYSALAERWQLTAEERSAKRGTNCLYKHEIRWARQELALAGLLADPSDSGRGVWRLRVTESVEGASYDEEATTFREGATHQIQVNAYERSRKARKACLAAYGYDCAVCGFNFEAAYGPVGRECIHVHHVLELSAVRSAYQVDPVADLIPVCPNCHYLIHRRRPAFTIEEVRAMLHGSKATSTI